MKIAAIGDPHGNLEKIKQISLKDVDLILLTGDLGNVQLMRELAFERIKRAQAGLPPKPAAIKQRYLAYMQAYSSTVEILKYLASQAPVFSIYGNVEENRRDTLRFAKEINRQVPVLEDAIKKIGEVTFLKNKMKKFGEIRIAGLDYFTDVSWVREFKPENYSKWEARAKKETQNAKLALSKFDKSDILICHQPPYGYLDLVMNKNAPPNWIGKNAGSKLILDYIMRKQPKYVFCGHIHEGEGNEIIGKSTVYNLGECGWKIIKLS